VTERSPLGPSALEDAQRYCAALARANAYDQWLGALYANPGVRDALLALASFDHEIRQAATRARDRDLAVMRLAWWRSVVRGEREEEAAGSQVALALGSAVKTFALPRALVESMLDARHQEIAPQDNFSLTAFESFAEESEGARLRLAARIAAGGRDLDEINASAPAALALALARMLAGLPFKAGTLPTLFPGDVAGRHGATLGDIDARRASPGVVAACAELRDLARERLALAERRLKASPPAILPAFIPLGALRLDLARLERNVARPFNPTGEPSRLRRQWAIWRWARGQ
jgi:phytoene synthase